MGIVKELSGLTEGTDELQEELQEELLDHAIKLFDRTVGEDLAEIVKEKSLSMMRPYYKVVKPTMLSAELAIKSKTVNLSEFKVLEVLKGSQKEVNEEAVDVEKVVEEEVIIKAAQEERRRQLEDKFRRKAAEEEASLKAK